MKITTISIAVITAGIIAACGSVKKGTSSTASSAPSSTTGTVPATNDYLFTKPANGIRPPGNEELAAIQLRYKNVTLEKLKEGHVLYTEGACVQCHRAQDIHEREQGQWENIIDDMALKANISDEQKDAVYKYVLAMIATQQK